MLGNHFHLQDRTSRKQTWAVQKGSEGGRRQRRTGGISGQEEEMSLGRCPVHDRMSQATAPARLPELLLSPCSPPAPVWQYDKLLSVRSLSANRGGDSLQCSSILSSSFC